jgi:hypothetical protein
LDTDGYTETGAQYPVTYASTIQTSTDVLGGVAFAYKFTPSLTGVVSAGVTQNERLSTGSVSGTSNLIGLASFDTVMPGQKYKAFGSGFGFIYDVDKYQRINIGLSYQEHTLTNMNVNSLSVGYTVGY